MKPVIPIRILALILVAFFSFSIKSCKKNSEFNVTIGFTSGINEKNDLTLQTSSAPQSVNDIFKVEIGSNLAASSDIRISILNNTDSLLNAYNLAHGTSIRTLPSSLWSASSELVIREGQKSASATILISNTTGLSFDSVYAVGFSINSISGGNTIASNLKNLFIVFRVMSMLDGRYKMKGVYTHPTLEPAFTPHDFEVELQSYYPYFDRLYWPLSNGYNNGYNGFGYNAPYTTNGGTPSWGLVYGLQLRLIPTSPTPNSFKIQVWHDTPPAVDAIFFPLDSCNRNRYINRVDTVTKTIYIAFGYNLGYNPTGQLYYYIPGQSRAWIDTLTYLGPR